MHIERGTRELGVLRTVRKDRDRRQSSTAIGGRTCLNQNEENNYRRGTIRREERDTWPFQEEEISRITRGERRGSSTKNDQNVSFAVHIVILIQTVNWGQAMESRHSLHCPNRKKGGRGRELA